MVSAFEPAGIALGQTEVLNGTSEITAVRTLPGELDLQGRPDRHR